MKVISTTEASYAENDRCIYESISLVERFGMYAIIVFRKMTGRIEKEQVFVLKASANYNTAIEEYKDCGGVLSEILD